MKRLGLGIDAGGSSTGWLLKNPQGVELARGRAGGITGLMFAGDESGLSPEGHVSMDRLKALLNEVSSFGRPTGVVMGAAGLEGGSRAALLLLETIAGLLDLPLDAVVVDNDMEIAYRSAFSPGEGVLLYGGTGSIAYHLPRSGPALRVGGFGYLIDDAGGGFWIGQQALRQVMRWHDEVGLPAGRPLAQEVYAQLGTSNWPGIRQAVYSGGRSTVAALAKAVVGAAGRGDDAAAAILSEAGTELARLANVALRRLGQLLPVTLMGGVASMGPQLLEAVQAGLPQGVPLKVSTEDPVQAAARLAARIRSATRSN